MPSENVPDSEGLICTDAQSDQGLHCPLPESLDTTCVECNDVEKRRDEILRVRSVM